VSIRRNLFILGGLSLFLAGCAPTAKLNAFDGLSKAGVAYVDAADAVITQAAEGGIAARTTELVVARGGLTKEKRLEFLTKQSEKLTTQLGLFGDIRRHQSLIKEYFVSLGALANAGDTDSAIGTAASDTVKALGALSEGFKDSEVGDSMLDKVVGEATPLAVAALRAKALERELRTNGAAINRELEVSEALMAFLAEKIKHDDEIVQGPKEAEAVFAPFVDDGPLPADWPARRAAFLQRATDLGAVGSAQDAARKLRLAFVAAAEDHLAPGQLQLLVSDLSRIADVLESIKKPPP
jgi:hypothetical protein